MGHPFFDVFWGLSQRGFLRIWASRLDAKRMPLEVVLETFPETLKTVICDYYYMVLAGPWGQKQRLFDLSSVTFFKTPF